MRIKRIALLIFLFVVFYTQIINCQTIINPPQTIDLNQLKHDTTVVSYLFNDSTKPWLTKTTYHYVDNKYHVLKMIVNPKFMEELKKIYSRSFLFRFNLDSSFFRSGIIRDDFINKE